MNIYKIGYIIILIVQIYGCQNQDKLTSPQGYQYEIGTVNKCFRIPAFPLKGGLKPPLMIDFRQRGTEKGFSILEARKDGQRMHLSEWEKFGHLGPYTLDEIGNIFTAPVPYVSLYDNPPSEQNQLLIIDASNGSLRTFLKLPSENIPSARNPFGVVGLDYDCETLSLYASSLAGSDKNNILGVIYQIDKKSKGIISKLEEVDALSVGIFKTKTGKRLYFGSARKPEVYSVALNESGRFNGKPKFEFSLAAQEGGSFDNAHQIRFLKDGIMQIKAIEFSYSLMAASDPLRNIYTFQYLVEKDEWQFKEVHQQ